MPQRGLLFWLLRGLEKLLVGLDGEHERRGVVFGAGQGGGVVGERGFGKVVLRKVLGDALPACHTVAGVGLGERPEVPGATIGGVDGLGAGGEFINELGATPFQPIGIGEADEGLGVVRTLGGEAFPVSGRLGMGGWGEIHNGEMYTAPWTIFGVSASVLERQ